MKRFFTFFTASCLGIFVAFMLFVLFFFVMIAVFSAGASDKEISSESILEIKLENAIPELTNNVEQSVFGNIEDNSLGLEKVKRLIERAASDRKIEGILLTGSTVGLGLSNLSSLASSIDSFKRSNKFIYSYADFYDQKAYYLASRADSIFLNPNGLVEIRGLGVADMFFKEVLDKYGIKSEVFYAGKYKGATETYRRNDFSQANKEQMREFLGDLFRIFKSEIAQNRNMPQADLNEIINGFTSFTASRSLNQNLVDDLLYWDQFKSFLNNKLDRDENKELKTISLDEYNASKPLKISKADDKIAIIYAEGVINYKTEAYGEVNEKNYITAFEKIRANDDIKAVVLRVNSPGGASITSDMIWREVEKTKAQGIPVVASYGDYAASGGYYISCNTDSIVAMPNTITGSIGVYMLFPEFNTLVDDKLQLNLDSVKTAPLALAFNPIYDLSDREKEILQTQTDELYDTFITKVAAGRSMTKEAVHEVAQGRVWSGEDALEVGLVDELGDIEKAIEIAAEMADIEKYKITRYPRIEENPFVEAIKEIQRSQKTGLEVNNLLTPEEQYWFKRLKETRNLLGQRKAQARMLMELEF